MLRVILAVLGGYAAMFVLIMLMNVALYFAFPDLFQEDAATYTGPDWILYLEAAASLMFAAVGGYVCKWIGRQRAVWTLVGLMVVLGVLTVVLEASQKPMWSIVATVVAGPIGALVGAAARKEPAS